MGKSKGDSAGDKGKKISVQKRGGNNRKDSHPKILTSGYEWVRGDVGKYEKIMGKSKWRELKGKFNIEEIPDVAVPKQKVKKQKIEVEKVVDHVGNTSMPRKEMVEGMKNLENVIDLEKEDTLQRQSEKNPDNEGAKKKSASVQVSESSESLVANLEASIAQLGFNSPIPQGKSSQSGLKNRPRSLHQRYDTENPLARLDHEDPAYIADKALIEKVGPVQGLDSVQVFLQRSIAVVDHWKKRWDKNASMMSKLRAENAQVGALNAEVSNLKKKLEESSKAFEISMRSNKTYAAKVDDLLKKTSALEKEKEIQAETVKALEKKAQDHEGNVQSLKDEMVELYKKNKACQEVIADNVRKIQEIENENKKLKKEIEATEYEVVAEHKKGFAKALWQVKCVAPNTDLTRVHVSKDVFKGKLVNEDDIPDDISSEENNE
ncbi:uncharacterized protein LOC109802602 [Cajanus cajan]|uniref:uncharacterized protein LOC109802602 n=1 Tax=Cajanus cajan TaxID=3821 RepID=UPI00098DA6AC|nr:uncharacterized protein LOC109802602 [Cajanus cajan]